MDPGFIVENTDSSLAWSGIESNAMRYEYSYIKGGKKIRYFGESNIYSKTFRLNKKFVLK